MMDSTINGRTPEEIKKGLECCKPKWESSRWVTCRDECPFRNEHAFCKNVLMACALALLYRLERERDEARNDLDTINYANTELHSAYEAMKRERDAAVEAMFLKPLSWDEAICDDAFLEIKGDEYIDAALNCLAFGQVNGNGKIGFVIYKTHEEDEFKLLEIDYGKTWRCWARRPTDEERAAAKWEVEG